MPLEKRIKMFLREFREKIRFSQKDVAKLLQLQAPALARYESLSVSPTASFLKKYCETIDANPNFILFGTEPHLLSSVPEMNIEQCDTVSDLLTLFAPDELKKRLRKLMINEILERIEKLDQNIISVVRALFEIGETQQGHTFIFLYHILQLIIVNPKEEDALANAKKYIIRRIQEFKADQFLFPDKIKEGFIDFFEVKASEDDCGILVLHANIILKLLEAKMPIDAIKKSRAIFQVWNGVFREFN